MSLVKAESQLGKIKARWTLWNYSLIIRLWEIQGEFRLHLFWRSCFVSEIDGQLYPQNKLASFLIGKNSFRSGVVSTSARIGFALKDKWCRNKMQGGLEAWGWVLFPKTKKERKKYPNSSFLWFAERTQHGGHNQGTETLTSWLLNFSLKRAIRSKRSKLCDT